MGTRPCNIVNKMMLLVTNAVQSNLKTLSLVYVLMHLFQQSQGGFVR